MRFIIISSFFLLTAARPQEFSFGDNDDVELIDPVVVNNEEDENEDVRPVVILVHGGRPNLGSGFPFSPFSGFPFFRNQPRYPSVFQNNFDIDNFGDSFADTFGDSYGDDSYESSFGESINSGLKDILGSVLTDRTAEEAPVEDGEVYSPPCGLICRMFGVLKNVAKPVIKSILSSNGTHPLWDGDYDINNSTYEEKILPDGSRVRINKTVLSDSDGFGGHFFFHSSVIHNIDDESSEETKQVPEAEAVVTEEEIEAEAEEIEAEAEEIEAEEEIEADVEKQEQEAEVESETNIEEVNDETEMIPNEVDTKLLEVDPAFNEIDDIAGDTSNVFNVDSGLME